MKIVLDTNVLVSGIFFGGNPLKLLDLWMGEQIEIIATSPILNEYVRVISCLGHKRPEFAKNWIDLITTTVSITETRISIDVSRDPDDNKFLECAVSGGADCIVSGDDDLLVLKAIHGIPILRVSVFLSRYS